MKKRILGLLVISLLMISLATAALADGGDYDFSDASSDVAGEGYTWTSEDNTLTITEAGLSIKDDGDALVLPADSSLVLNGDLDIESYNYGIYAAGSLSIMGTGELVIEDGDGIYAAGNIIICDSVQVSTYCIQSCMDMTISGDAVVNISYLDATGNISMEDYATVNAECYIFTDTATSTISVANTVTLNGLTSACYDDSLWFYNDKVYGTVLADDADIFYQGALSFCAGSELIISEGVIADLTIYAINWDNANITNDGVIEMRVSACTAEAIADLGISGDGYIVLLDGDVETAYKNDGTVVDAISAVAEVLELNEQEVSNDTYSWTVGDDGVYTLSFKSDTVVAGTLFLNVGNAVIDVSNEVIVMDEIYTTANLSITGTEHLIATAITNQNHQDEDAAINVAEKKLVIDGHVTADIEWMGGVTVNGDLVSGYIVAVDLSVNNGASLDSAEGIYLSDSEAPTFSLGSKMIIRYPSNCEYVVSEYNENGYTYYVGTVTTDGKTIADDMSNIAYNLTVREDTNSFIDIDSTAYYYEAVLWAQENGIASDEGDGMFSPDLACTRAQAINFLWRAAGEPEASADAAFAAFTDVEEGSYYYDAVIWGVENGIISGTSETTFDPDAVCSRGHIATMLWRVAGQPAEEGYNPFADVDASEWYYDAVLWAVENDITKGTTENSFEPNANCTRAAIITLIYRYMA